MEINKVENIADMALANSAETVKQEPIYVTSKYVPGFYRSDKYFRVIRELTYEHTKDANGNIQRTTGTWARPSNVIIFQKGVETRLTAEDLALPAIRSLIDRKVIYRIG